jgi:DNA-binding transcriptional ArsR family regulator
MPDPLSAAYSALADPTRRAILAHLAQGEATVNELADPFEISLPVTSRHLKVLQGAGLISRGREAQWRPCRLEPERLKAVDDWLWIYRRFGSRSWIGWQPTSKSSAREKAVSARGKNLADNELHRADAQKEVE